MTRKRRQRRHGDLPSGFVWREGRPRWEPSPARRKAGWRGVDLKDAWGRWLALGPAIERATAIAEAAAELGHGRAIPAAFAAFAPKGSASGGAAKGALSPRSIGALADAWMAHPEFTSLAASTQRDYRGKHRRFLGVLAGGAAKADAARALDIDILLPPDFGAAGRFHLQDAYDTLRGEAGESMALGVLAAVSAWLGWCVRIRRVWPTNPTSNVSRAAPQGRIVVWEWPELVALVREADAAGLASIADAVVLAVDLAWSQQDLLALDWGQVDAAGLVKHRRIKTGVAGRPRLLAIGAARMELIKARWKDAKVRPTRVLICELTGKPWEPSTFRHAFADIRAAVAAYLPEAAFKQFRDLRDTAVTYGYEAGLEIAEICSRTLHDPTRAQAVIQKHYGAIRQAVADVAASKLDAHYLAKGYSFEALLALPKPEVDHA